MRLFTPVIFSSILFVVGCAGNSTVSRTADINKYQYVVDLDCGNRDPVTFP